MKKEKGIKNGRPEYEWETVHPGTKRFMAYAAAVSAGKRKITPDGGGRP